MTASGSGVVTTEHRHGVVACLVLVVAVLAVLVAGAVPASAHAVLVGTDPADGTHLEAAPTQVTLTFNEPVEVPTGAVRVFDADAGRVDAGPLDTGNASLVAVALPEDLPDGGYVVTYRVLSADAHPIGGVLTFTVGDGEGVDSAIVGELVAGSGGGVALVIGPAVRGASYLATLLAAGAALFALTVAPRPADVRSARRVAVGAAVVGTSLALLSVPVQAAVVSGEGATAAMSVTSLGEVVTSTFGTGVLVRAAALLWLVVLWRPTIPTAVPAVAGAVAAASFALDGHQRSVEPAWLLVGGDIVHLLAAASWFGGLVVLAGVLRRRALDDDPLEAAGIVARFSSVALVTFAVVAASGVAMAVPLVGTPGALIASTYGWMLIAKVAAVTAAVLLAVYNRQRLVPSIAARRFPTGGSLDAPPDTAERQVARSRRAWERLRIVVRLEVVILSVVLLITGALVSIQPASEAAGTGGLYETTASLAEGLQVDVVVDPNQVGRNAVHLYALDATGRPSSDVEDLRLELTYVPEGIGPVVIEPFFAGTGHWVANTDDLRFAGDWELRIVVGLDRFTEEQVTVTVPVAP